MQLNTYFSKSHHVSVAIKFAVHFIMIIIQSRPLDLDAIQNNLIILTESHLSASDMWMYSLDAGGFSVLLSIINTFY